MVEESLDDLLQTSLHNARTNIRPIVYNVVNHIMLELLGKHVIGETLDAHVAKYFYTNAGADGVSKILLTSCSFIAPVATFLRLKMDAAIEYMKYSTVFVSKEQFDTVAKYKDVGKPPLRCSDTGNDRSSRRKSLKWRLKTQPQQAQD